MPDQERPTSKAGWVVARLLTPIYNAWRWVRDWLRVLKPCRFALLMLLGALMFLIVVPQGQDVLRALAERHTGHRDEWQRAFFFISVLTWALSGWYWTRVMLRLRFNGVPEHDPRLQQFRIWVPRIIGFVATLGVAYALYRASLGYTEREYASTRDLLRNYSLWCLFGAFAFLVAVSSRRSISIYAYNRLRSVAAAQRRYVAPVVNLLNVRQSTDEVYGTLNFSDLQPLTRWLLYAALGLAVFLFLMFTLWLQRAAPTVGSAAILLFAATGWVAVGSMLDFIGMRLQFPVFSTLFLLAVVFSIWNDNHAVRTVAGPRLLDTERKDLRATLRSWLTRQQSGQLSSVEKYPMFLVDAEGGGIRAAYWTATVLGEIQDRNPCFAEQLFSLSGVSGGSLGSAVFVALLAEQGSGAETSRCALTAKGFSFKQKAQEILSEDFLSPVVASLLYPDLLQRILFWPVERFDRARALEGAWERAWRVHVPESDRFAQPIDQLWANKKVWTPALLLNATWVETGKRLMTSNIRILPFETNGSRDFVDVEDVLHFFQPRSLALSTAAHLSARFTYVSPAGTLVKDGTVHGRAVDGGYFENSGATTTMEILRTIDLLAKEDRRWARVEPIVIHISNEPVDPTGQRESLPSASTTPAIAPRRWLNEIRSPILTLLKTRDARGVYARETVRSYVGQSNFLNFGLCRRAANIPLGWVLSLTSRQRMEAQLTKEACIATRRKSKKLFDNPGNLKKIDYRLAALSKVQTQRRH